MRLIIISLYKPVLGFELSIDAIERLLALALELHVPFITRPAVVAPPITGRSPWSSQVDDFSINTALLAPRADLRGPTLMRLNDRPQRRAKPAKAKTLPRRNGSLRVLFSPPPAIRISLQRETLEAERIRTMIVELRW